MQEQETKKKIRRRILVAAAVLAVTAVLLLAIVGMFRITEVSVTGNEYYTSQEIVDFVLGDGYQRNTLYLYLHYKYGKHPVIPFVDDFEVTIDSLNSIRIRVYEKSIVGYVRYLGRNVYFDKNGTVVESSDELMEGVPMIRGLYFDQLAMYQPLNVEDPKIFDTILNITQLLKKYDLNLDEIRFSSGEEVNMKLGEVRISLGTGDHMEEKIARIKELEPNLLDKSGTLDMKNYTEESTHISLEANKQQ